MLLALTPDQAGAATPARPRAAAERAALEAIRSGDERQAATVYACLLPAVQGTLLRVLGAPDRNHQRLTQHGIEQVIAELAGQSAGWRCSLEVCATAVAARLALEVLRGRAQRHGTSAADAMAGSSSGRPDAESPGSAIDRLRWLLTELPPQQAEAVVLCDVMGLAAADVAPALGVGVEHVRRLLSAGHERLARQMAGEAA